MLGLEFGGGGDFHSRGGLLSERGGGVGSAALTGPVLTRAVAAYGAARTFDPTTSLLRSQSRIRQ